MTGIGSLHRVTSFGYRVIIKSNATQHCSSHALAPETSDLTITSYRKSSVITDREFARPHSLTMLIVSNAMAPQEEADEEELQSHKRPLLLGNERIDARNKSEKWNNWRTFAICLTASILFSTAMTACLTLVFNRSSVRRSCITVPPNELDTDLRKHPRPAIPFRRARLTKPRPCEGVPDFARRKLHRIASIQRQWHNIHSWQPRRSKVHGRRRGRRRSLGGARRP